MANELNIALTTTGLTTVTARLVQAGAYVGSAIALSESPASSGFYTGNVSGGTSAGTYEVIFLSSGATVGSGRLFWDGSAEIDTRTINTRVQSIPTNPLLTTDTRLNNLDATISSRLSFASYTAPPAASANASAVRTELTTELGRIDATISSRLASASYTAPTTPPTASQNAAAVRTELTLELARIDQPISSRSTFDHTGDRVDIGAVQGVAIQDINDFKADVSQLARETTLIALVPPNAIAQIYTYTNKRSKLEGFEPGISADFVAPTSEATPGSITTSDGDVVVEILQLPGGVRRVQPNV